MMTTTKFLRTALTHIQSDSIRAWAKSPHNAPIVAEMAANARRRAQAPEAFATFLVACAMGL